MTRTFTLLASLVTVALFATIAVGLWSFILRLDGRPSNELFIVHFYLGLGTALGILLVHCIIFTYFLGTGRWVKEVAIAYRLPDEPYPKRTRELKRKTFPPALFSMLIVIATAAAGAGAQLQAWPWYLHAILAGLTVAINLWGFRVEYDSVTENAAILEAVLDEVDKVRMAQGLESNAQALAREEQE